MRKPLHVLPFVVGAALLSLACTSTDGFTDSSSASELRGLSTEEALAELDLIGQSIRGLYAPLEFKRGKKGFDLSAELTSARKAIQRSRNESDRVGAIMEFLDKLDDGHVGLSYTARGSESVNSTLPLVIVPVENEYVVEGGPASVSRGDILLSIDGMAAREIERRGRAFTRGTAPSRKQFAAMYMTVRPFYLPEALRPTKAVAEIALKRANGTTYTVSLPWTKTPGRSALEERDTEPHVGVRAIDRAFYSPSARALVSARTGFSQYGAELPLFLTDPVKERFQLVEVHPNAATLAEAGVEASANIILHAYKYRHQGKVVLLMRVPHFYPPFENPDDQVSWAAALLRDNRAGTSDPSGPAANTTPLAEVVPDVLVIDETHNSGGYASMVAGFGSLLTDKPIGNFVQANHADRRWYSAFLGAADEMTDAAEKSEWLSRAAGIEDALDTRRWLAPAVPLTAPSWGAFQDSQTAGRSTVQPHPFAQWTKPVLVLADELCASGGDFFPAIVQKNGLGKVFGAQTWGAGGSVEEVVNLPYSNATLYLTRGMAAIQRLDGRPPAQSDFLENNGVVPDYPYQPTLADYRGQFVEYVTKFSDVAVSLRR